MLDLVVTHWFRFVSALIGGSAGLKAAEEARRAVDAKAAEEARRAADAKAEASRARRRPSQEHQAIAGTFPDGEGNARGGL